MCVLKNILCMMDLHTYISLYFLLVAIYMLLYYVSLAHNRFEYEHNIESENFYIYVFCFLITQKNNSTENITQILKHIQMQH